MLCTVVCMIKCDPNKRELQFQLLGIYEECCELYLPFLQNVQLIDIHVICHIDF